MIKIAICRNDSYGEALSVILNETDGFNVVGKFDSVSSAMSHLHVKPDIFLVDFADSEHKTFTNIEQIKSRESSSKVIMLTDHEEKESIIGCVRAGIDGYLLRRTSIMALRDSILEAYSGGFPLSPIVARKLMDTFSSQHDEPIAHTLTTREKQVLKLLVDGLSYKLISAQMDISIDTVRSHIKKLYEKLKVNSKSEAVSKALKNGLVS